MRRLTPSQSFHICVLVYVPHFDRTVMRGAVKVMSSSPEGKTLKQNEHEPNEDLRVAPNIIHSVDRMRGLYRHRAFVSREFIQMFACFCFPDHYQFVHITSGLQKKCIIGRRWRYISANRSRTPYQIFSIWWDGHTQDVTSVPNMSVLRSFPSTWNCAQLLPALDIPCRNLNQKYEWNFSFLKVLLPLIYWIFPCRIWKSTHT